MKKQVRGLINGTAFSCMIIGIAGVAGCIECGTSPAVAALVLSIGVLLYQGEGATEE